MNEQMRVIFNRIGDGQIMLVVIAMLIVQTLGILLGTYAVVYGGDGWLLIIGLCLIFVSSMGGGVNIGLLIKRMINNE